jgi:molecular chaperone DnaJ
MRGKGIPHLHGSGVGDQLIQIQVYVPTKLNPKERSLLAEFENSENFKPDQDEEKTIFEKFKDALNF